MSEKGWICVVDIETAASPDEWVHERLAGNVRPDRRMTKAETIAKWEAEEKPAKVAEALAKGALSGTYGQITAIGWNLWPGGETQVIARDADLSEAEMLRRFFTAIRDHARASRGLNPKWAGYNVAGFDLRFLYQRAVANGVEMGVGLPYDAPPWSDKVLDLMQWWCGTKDRVRKEDVCRALGVPVPDDAISGAEMPGLWMAGQYATIAYHVRQDVDMTVALLERCMTTLA